MKKGNVIIPTEMKNERILKELCSYQFKINMKYIYIYLKKHKRAQNGKKWKTEQTNKHINKLKWYSKTPLCETWAKILAIFQETVNSKVIKVFPEYKKQQNLLSLFYIVNLSLILKLGGWGNAIARKDAHFTYKNTEVKNISQLNSKVYKNNVRKQSLSRNA